MIFILLHSEYSNFHLCKFDLQDLLFTFSNIRESPVIDNPKTLRSLIRNISGGSSPILGRKSTGTIKKLSEMDCNNTKRPNTKGKMTPLSKTEMMTKRSTSCDSRLTRNRDSSVDKNEDCSTKDKISASYILLSQVRYNTYNKFLKNVV